MREFIFKDISIHEDLLYQERYADTGDHLHTNGTRTNLLVSIIIFRMSDQRPAPGNQLQGGKYFNLRQSECNQAKNVPKKQTQ